ncbi:alpha/beta fold hydrolase [Catenuloplanes japonicus]|uniref:alpha/beta fold hydrolase n=1 Tax=Catenuloplanes japonicus TaxID=33876 RepID=UPI000524989B|nr:alpha/beta fold hydrolase [Catenuloplanes japonicus]
MTSQTPSRVRRAAVAFALPVLMAGGLVACSEGRPVEAPEAGAPSAPVAGASSAPASGTPASELRMVETNGHTLAFHVTPGRLPAIVLDAGGGEDSSYWSALVPQLARTTGAAVITYDRAGLGDSDEVPGAWDPQAAASDLESGLRRLGMTEGVVLVSHSQAGEVATYTARTHPDLIAAAVLVDANLPPFFTEEQTARIIAATAPQIEALKAQPSTKQTRQLIATAESFGPVHAAYHKLTWPGTIPVTVIVSEKTPFDGSPDDAQHWRDAAASFAKAGPDRTLVTALGTSHDVPKDAPALVLDEIVKMTR